MQGQRDHEHERGVADRDLVRRNHHRAERAHEERGHREQRTLGYDRAGNRDAEGQDLAECAAVGPLEMREQAEAAVDGVAALVDVDGREHRPAGERGRDTAAPRALRRDAEAAQREQPVAGEVGRKADRGGVHHGTRPADALAGVAMREEHQHRRHSEAHGVDVAGRVRDGARVGAEPAQQGLDAGERADERHGEHQREPVALAKAPPDFLVAAGTVGLRHDRRDGHQHAEPEQPEHLVIAAADGDARERFRAEAAGEHGVREHHAGEHEVVDEQRPREPEDRARVTREGVRKAAGFAHGTHGTAGGARRGGPVGMLAF